MLPVANLVCHDYAEAWIRPDRNAAGASPAAAPRSERPARGLVTLLIEGLRPAVAARAA